MSDMHFLCGTSKRTAYLGFKPCPLPVYLSDSAGLSLSLRDTVRASEHFLVSVSGTVVRMRIMNLDGAAFFLVVLIFVFSS